MKTPDAVPMILLVSVTLLALPADAAPSHVVRGYHKKDGTYVQAHRQTDPNGTRLDNWGTQGNVNPYTGKAGTADPYAPPSTKPHRHRP